MKLQNQYNKISVGATSIVLIVAAMGYFFLLHYLLIDQVDDALRVEEAEIIHHIKAYDSLPAATVFKDQRIAFKKGHITSKPVYKSLSSYNPDEQEKELSRQLLFPVTVNGVKYTAIITKSQEATEELLGVILAITIVLILILSILLFITNKLLLQRLWRPFSITLSAIKQFDLASPSAINLPPTQIDEFRELNESITMMIEKVTRDYKSLKNFTDQASHEIQTPLAIINSKLDNLIQDPQISEKILHQLHAIYNAIGKLSRLSDSLLLLSKIDNNQFKDIHLVRIDELVKEKFVELEEWVHLKNLFVACKLSNLQVRMHEQLAEILVGNLITNAIRHNIENGTIKVTIEENIFRISNNGLHPLNSQHVFDRFYKEDHSDGNGLGMAIVQQICEQYGFFISYKFENGKHLFTLDFIHETTVKK